jgi:ABC-type Fe3+/spermidine/putrescine transport system ATPase subunit
MGYLELQNLSINYGETAIVRDLSLSVSNGEIVTLLGPSGAGKTTILKAIAGLLKPGSGKIFINGIQVNHLSAEKRDAVLIFQKPLLFPFLNVSQNVGFGLKMQQVDRKEAERKISKILEITMLTGLQDRKIHQLSGGQQQRVALARGLVLEPSILLLDEPLSNLDAGLRQQMRELIQAVQKQTGITMLFVTHDQSEALAISDRVCLLLDGRLRQVGKPEELFYLPADPEVARFFGCDNILCSAGDGEKNITAFSDTHLNKCSNGEKPFTIRPEDIEILPASQTSLEVLYQSFEGRVTGVTFEGQLTRLTIEVKKNQLTVLCSRPTYRIGQSVRLRMPKDCVHFFPLIF